MLYQIARQTASAERFDLLVLPESGVSFIHCQKDPLNPERIPQKEVAHVRTGVTDAALLVHSFNHFPEMLSLLEKMRDMNRSLVAGYRSLNVDDLGQAKGSRLVDDAEVLQDDATRVIQKVMEVKTL
jgi:hypothetical protein